MATRLYLTNLNQTGKLIAPTGTVVKLLSKSKGGSSTSISATNGYGSAFYPLAYFLSDPVRDAHTFSGTCTFSVGVGQNTDIDYFVIAVDANLSDAPTAAVPYGNNIFNNFAPDSSPSPAAGVGPTMNLGSTPSIEAGQRLLFYTQQYNGGTSTVYYGGTGGTDLTIGSTSVTTQPGWVEFSEDIAFLIEDTGGFFL